MVIRWKEYNNVALEATISEEIAVTISEENSLVWGDETPISLDDIHCKFLLLKYKATGICALKHCTDDFYIDNILL